MCPLSVSGFCIGLVACAVVLVCLRGLLAVLGYGLLGFYPIFLRQSGWYSQRVVYYYGLLVLTKLRSECDLGLCELQLKRHRLDMYTKEFELV